MKVKKTYLVITVISIYVSSFQYVFYANTYLLVYFIKAITLYLDLYFVFILMISEHFPLNIFLNISFN